MFRIEYYLNRPVTKQEITEVLKNNGKFIKTLNFPLAGKCVTIEVTNTSVLSHDYITGSVSCGGPEDIQGKVDMFFEQIENFKQKYLHLM